MKIDSILKIIFAACICLLADGAYAGKNKPKSNASCATLFLLSELELNSAFKALELNSAFKAKLALIKKSGWSIEFDAEMTRDSFVDIADGSSNVLNMPRSLKMKSNL